MHAYHESAKHSNRRYPVSTPTRSREGTHTGALGDDTGTDSYSADLVVSGPTSNNHFTDHPVHLKKMPKGA